MNHKKVVKVTGFLFCIILYLAVKLLTLLGIAFLYVAINSTINGIDVTDIPKSMSIDITTTNTGNSEVDKAMEEIRKEFENMRGQGVPREGDPWYATTEDAVKDDSLLLDPTDEEHYRQFIDREFARVRVGDKVYVYCWIDNMEGAIYYMFHMKDGTYSAPCRLGGFLFGNRKITGGRYDLDDSVAKFMSDEYLLEGVTDDLLYGTWIIKEEVESLTIEGKPPEGIIPFDMEGKTYYFWYYTSLEDLTEKMKTVNYGHYTLGEIIELMDVKYEKQGEEKF